MNIPNASFSTLYGPNIPEPKAYGRNKQADLELTSR